MSRDGAVVKAYDEKSESYLISRIREYDLWYIKVRKNDILMPS